MLLRLEKITINIIVFLLSIIFIFPYFWIISNAFKEVEDILSIPPIFFPKNIYLNNFHKLFTEWPFAIWIKNSLIVSIQTTIGVLFLSSLSGFAFAKLKFPFKNYLFTIMLITNMIPFTVMIIPLYIFISTKLHLSSSLIAVILPFLSPPIAIFMMRQFISYIPDELLEAAKLEGTGYFTIYYKIIIPLSMPGMATLGILTFMNNFNNFFWPSIILQNESSYTVPIGFFIMNNIFPGQEPAFGAMMVGAFIVSLPVVVLFLLVQKKYIAALSLNIGK